MKGNWRFYIPITLWGLVCLFFICQAGRRVSRLKRRLEEEQLCDIRLADRVPRREWKKYYRSAFDNSCRRLY